jgi:CheY-like chemotaxis protein
MARILIIDDDSAVRVAIRLLLEREGYEVVDAEDGRAGIAALKASVFDIVICDIFMPGMDGLETIREFHRYNPDARSSPYRASRSAIPRRIF